MKVSLDVKTPHDESAISQADIVVNWAIVRIGFRNIQRFAQFGLSEKTIDALNCRLTIMREQ